MSIIIFVHFFFAGERHQRNKLKLDNLSLGTSPERMRPLRHQHSTDNMHAVNNFNIPFVKVEQRKTCSEENMIKTHSSSKLFSYFSCLQQRCHIRLFKNSVRDKKKQKQQRIDKKRTHCMREMLYFLFFIAFVCVCMSPLFTPNYHIGFIRYLR